MPDGLFFCCLPSSSNTVVDDMKGIKPCYQGSRMNVSLVRCGRQNRRLAETKVQADRDCE